MGEVHATGVSGRVGKFSGDLRLLGFQFRDLLFTLRDIGFQFPDIGSGGLGGGLGLFGLRGFILLRSSIGEASGEGGALVARLGFFEVVGVVAGIRRQASGMHVQYGLGDFADEVHVVADEEERAFVVLQGGNQRINRHDIEVRGRLIHQQEVRRIDHQLHQREA